MSGAAEEKVEKQSGAAENSCASCGIAGGDDFVLKNCTACYLAKYCSVKCQKEHRPKHKKECKRRAAELRDELLFKQPESSHLGDCPICCLPLSLDVQKSTLMSCCSTMICQGCSLADNIRELQRNFEHKCPFCRHILPRGAEESKMLIMKRVEANDPVAMTQRGLFCTDEGDYKSTFEYWTKAAKLGDINAHYFLSNLYQLGQGVEKDKKKRDFHLEEAAIGGHPTARHNLGSYENDERGCRERAVKHFIISAKLGYDGSLENLKHLYKQGAVSREDFAEALRGHKAAVDATKSPQRKEAEEYAEFASKYEKEGC